MDKNSVAVVIEEIGAARGRIFERLSIATEPAPKEFIELYITTLLSEAMALLMGRGLDPQLPSAEPVTVEAMLAELTKKLQFAAQGVDPVSSYIITVTRKDL